MARLRENRSTELSARFKIGSTSSLRCEIASPNLGRRRGGKLVPVRDFARAGRFYDAVLATIGLKRTKESSGAIGYGTEVGLPPEFWILEQHDPSAARSGIGLHVSFRVRSRDEVHAFHAAA